MALSPAIEAAAPQRWDGLAGWNPLRVSGTPMPANLLLLCKVLAVAILATGHYRILPDPFLPFLPGLDALDPIIFRTTLQTVAVASAVLLLLNRQVRLTALVLGSCLLVGVLSSKAYYGNNKTFVGLALVLAGLSDFDRPPYLLRWQLALVYFGAALNKLLLDDWLTGQFFEHWGRNNVKNPVYIWASDLLPALVAGKIMCWGTIVAEFAVSFGLLVPRLVPFALLTNVFFQVGLLEFTGGTFTLFFYAMQAANLAFLHWPATLELQYDPTRPLHRAALFLLRCVNFDNLVRSEGTAEERRPFRLSVNGGAPRTGFVALRTALFYSAGFWLVATAALALLPGGATLARRVLVGAAVAFFIPWEKLRRSR